MYLPSHQWTDRSLLMTPFLHLPLLFCSLAGSLASKHPAIARPLPSQPRGHSFEWRQNQSTKGNYRTFFLDNQGFPDQSNDNDNVLHNIDGGPVLWKLCRTMPNLDGPIYLRFNSPFIPKQHKYLMHKQVDLSHLDPNFQEQVYNLTREY
jgi:hypothetical protein